MALLEVENLGVTLKTSAGPADAVRDVSFGLERGSTLGIVGESGCGKSMTALALIGLLPDVARTRGAIRLGGENLLEKSETEMCAIRGNQIAMIFQEPMTSLNPVHTVGRQIMEPMLVHRGIGRAEAERDAIRLMERVGIPNARARIDAYPHQMSGGQRQRVMIAIALSCSPLVLIADEPTTALDVTIQAQILDLIHELVNEEGMALILISHDLGVISENADDVLVMYGGAVIERAPTASLFDDLSHPYTQGLFAAVPRLGRGRGRLATIPGTVPDLADLPHGCTFAGRCPLAIEDCSAAPPRQMPVSPGHSAACIRLDVARERREKGLYA
jgi:peptide/nickel transport system ATP-binding protein